MKLKLLLVFAIVSSLVGCSQSSRYEYLKDSFIGPFDTVIEYMSYVKNEDDFNGQMKIIKEELTRLDHLFDKYTSYEGINNIKTINDNAGIKPVKVDLEIIDMISSSVDGYHNISNKVNITMGAVLSLWHTSRDNAVDNIGIVPSTSQLEEARTTININNIEIDQEASTIYITNSKTSIDVGATAKGYAIEYVKQKLIENGAEAFIISGGGNIASHGTRKLDATGNDSLPRSKDEFLVGIETPRNGAYTDSYPALVIATDVAIVTSGDYQRYFYDKDGNVYNHLIDPDTLYPTNYFRSVTVITKDSKTADFLSTALFLVPYETGRAMVDSLDDVEAIWLMNDGSVLFTEGLIEGDNIYINK